MTTWPSSNKAQTTTTDQPTDTISGARDDINKTISNVNDIIDIFDITSPTDGDVLIYNNSNSRFELGNQPTRCLLQYDSGVADNNSVETLYNGGFTIKGNANDVSVVNTSTIQIQAGDYIIRPLTERNSGVYGGNTGDGISARLRDTTSAAASVAYFPTHSTSFYHRTWGSNTVYLNITTTQTYQWYWFVDTNSGSALDDMAFLIDRLE
jgi:hypothetical protein